MPSGWIGVDEYDYEVTDFVLEKFFARLPNAYIIPRIKLTVPLLWCSAYPKDVHVYYNGPKTEEEIKATVCAHAEIAPLIEGKTIKKCIIVKGRLVNLIVG